MREVWMLRSASRATIIKYSVRISALCDGKSIVESLYAEMTERSLFLVDSHNII